MSNSYNFVKRPTKSGVYGISSSAYFASNSQYFRAHRTKYTAHNQCTYALSINRTAHLYRYIRASKYIFNIMFHLWRERNIIILIYDRLNTVDTKILYTRRRLKTHLKTLESPEKLWGVYKTRIHRCWQRKSYNFLCALRDNNRYL